MAWYCTVPKVINLGTGNDVQLTAALSTNLNITQRKMLGYKKYSRIETSRHVIILIENPVRLQRRIEWVPMGS